MTDSQRKGITAIVVFLIVIASAGIFIKYYTSNEISALDGKLKADERASKLLPNSTLYSVGNYGVLHDNGKSSAWEYRYFLREENCYKMIMIYVHGNGNIDNSTIGDFTLDSVYNEYKPIVNWTMDSTVLFSLALQNDEIKDFVAGYPNSLEGMGLGIKQSIPDVNNYSGEIPLESPLLCWTIGWQYLGGHENYHRAQIIINEENGEYLYVQTEL